MGWMGKAMKLTAEREKLLAPLQAVIGVVERRQTMPVLANVLLGVARGQLSITATDLEVELVARRRGSGGKWGRAGGGGVGERGKNPGAGKNPVVFLAAPPKKGAAPP